MQVVSSSTSQPWRIGLIAWVLLIATGFAGAFLGRSRPSAPSPPVVGALSVDPNEPWLGFAINCHHISDLDLYLEGVDSIAAMGANALLVVTPWYQTRVDSSEIRHVPRRCPTEEQLLAIIRRAQQHGLRTALMPIVLLEQAGESDWRGVIQPSDWDAWWRSYEAFNEHFLGLAQRAEVDLYFIGSELNSTEQDLSRWQRVIANARERFDGQLAYSANWDRFDQVSFWRMVDFLAVSSYFELEARDEPRPVAELTRVWEATRDRLLAHAERYDRPLIISEVGYPSLSTGAAFPWNYTDTSGGTFDPATQARAWEAFLNAWRETIPNDDRAAGFFGYRWDPYHAGERTDTGYGVRGKPAQRFLERAFKEWRSPEAAESPPAD